MTAGLTEASAILASLAAPGGQSALDPVGPQAAHIYAEWQALFWVCTTVFIVTMLFLIVAISRRRREETQTAEQDRRMTTAVSIATGMTIFILFGLLLASISTGHALASLDQSNALTIELTGHQWWWEVNYPDPISSNSVTTANEIHVPVGRTVVLKLRSRDVIHSFWIPRVHGKRDLIPSHTMATVIRVDKEGIYPGQCAEFCGAEHAKMRLLLIAESPAKFAAWLSQQRQEASSPHNPVEARGRQVFLSAPCVMCHTIAGTGAYGKNGPDLTHFGSRKTLGAGTLPNNPGGLSGWIVDPQGIKPGNRMPQNDIDSRDLIALTAYLESLK